MKPNPNKDSNSSFSVGAHKNKQTIYSNFILDNYFIERLEMVYTSIWVKT